MIEDLSKYYSRKEMMEAAAAGEEIRTDVASVDLSEVETEINIGSLFGAPAVELPSRRRSRVRSSAII